MKLTGLVVSFICFMAAEAKRANVYEQGAIVKAAGSRKDVKQVYKADKKKKQPVKSEKQPSKPAAIVEVSDQEEVEGGSGFINAYESQVHDTESEPEIEEAPVGMTGDAAVEGGTKGKPIYAQPAPQRGRPIRKRSRSSSSSSSSSTTVESSTSLSFASTSSSSHRQCRNRYKADKIETMPAKKPVEQAACPRRPPTPIQGCKPVSSSTSSVSCSDSSRRSSRRHCIPLENYLSCTKEQAVVAVERVNKLFDALWAEREMEALMTQAVIPESYYRIREPVAQGVCMFIEGPLFDYLEQPGVFSSFVEKYTYNKGTGAVTVNVIEVGVSNGQTVVRKLKRKYITLRGCEYKLYTVTGSNFKCLDCE